METGVYEIVSSVGVSDYVGSTARDFKMREREHFNDLRGGGHYAKWMQRHFNKHGEVLEFVVLEYCEPEKCLEREQYYLDNFPYVWNTCRTAGSSLGVKRRPETRQKNREVTKKQWQDPEFRAKNIEAQAKGRANPEYGVNQSVQKKKQWQDPEFRANQIEWKKKMWEDPEYRKNGREVRKKVWADPEYRKKRSEDTKKRSADPEVKKRMKEAGKKVWEDPKYRKMQSDAHRSKLSDEQVAEIRELRLSGISYNKIAALYPVSWGTIRRICRGENGYTKFD